MPSPVPIATRSINPPQVGRNNYQPFGFREEVLPRGWTGQECALPLPCDIHASHDGKVQVRDGSNPHIDIYRPNTTEPVPAILAWGSFGTDATQKPTLCTGKIRDRISERYRSLPISLPPTPASCIPWGPCVDGLN